MKNEKRKYEGTPTSKLLDFVYVDMEIIEGEKVHGCILAVFNDVLFLADALYQSNDINDTFRPMTNVVPCAMKGCGGSMKRRKKNKKK